MFTHRTAQLLLVPVLWPVRIVLAGFSNVGVQRYCWTYNLHCWTYNLPPGGKCCQCFQSQHCRWPHPQLHPEHTWDGCYHNDGGGVDGASDDDTDDEIVWELQLHCLFGSCFCLFVAWVALSCIGQCSCSDYCSALAGGWVKISKSGWTGR